MKRPAGNLAEARAGLLEPADRFVIVAY